MNVRSQKMIKSLFVVLIIIFADFLSGCQQQNDNSDLLAFIEEVNKRPKGQIQPLPELRDNKLMDRKIGRNPFKPLIKDKE